MRAPPGSKLAHMRQAAHRAFDPIWQSGDFTRSEAYTWLAAQLSIPKEKCHMVHFDEAMCQKVIDICLAEELEAVV